MYFLSQTISLSSLNPELRLSKNTSRRDFLTHFNCLIFNVTLILNSQELLKVFIQKKDKTQAVWNL